MSNLKTLKGLGNQIVNLSCTIDLIKNADARDFTASHKTLEAMQQTLDYLLSIDTEQDKNAILDKM